MEALGQLECQPPKNKGGLVDTKYISRVINIYVKLIALFKYKFISLSATSRNTVFVMLRSLRVFMRLFKRYLS